MLFDSEHVETKEITVKLLKIIQHTFENTTYSKAIRFRKAVKENSSMEGLDLRRETSR